MLRGVEFVNKVAIVTIIHDTTFSELDKLEKSIPIIFFTVFDKSVDYRDLDIGDFFITYHKQQYKDLVDRYSLDNVMFMYPLPPIISDKNENEIVCTELHNVYERINKGLLFIHASNNPEFYRQSFPDNLHELFCNLSDKNRLLDIVQKNEGVYKYKQNIRKFQDFVNDDIEIRDSRTDFNILIKGIVKRKSLPVYTNPYTRVYRFKQIHSYINKKMLTRQDIIYKLTGDPSHKIPLNYKSFLEFDKNTYPIQHGIVNYTEWQHMLCIPENTIFDTSLDKTFGTLEWFYRRSNVIPFKKKWIGIIGCETTLDSSAFKESINSCEFLITGSKSMMEKIISLGMKRVKYIPWNNNYKPNELSFKFSKNIFDKNPNKILYISKNIQISDSSLPGIHIKCKIMPEFDFDQNDGLVVLDGGDYGSFPEQVYSCINKHIPMYININISNSKCSSIALEILGRGYPLYYETLYDLIGLLENETLITEAYDYICDLERNIPTMSEYVDSINSILLSSQVGQFGFETSDNIGITIAN